MLRTGKPLLATPEILSELEKQGEIELIGAPSIDWLGVPLKIREKTIGVLVVQTYSPGLRYGQDEKNILMFVSNQVAMAIERKRSEADLRRSEQKNRAVLSAMPDLMFLLDRDGVVPGLQGGKGQRPPGEAGNVPGPARSTRCCRRGWRN